VQGRNRQRQWGPETTLSAKVRGILPRTFLYFPRPQLLTTVTPVRMPHFIRLRGAWNVERADETDGCRSVRLSRQFGCSAGLKAAPRVWLVIDGVAGRAAINLNDHPLGIVVGQGAGNQSLGQRSPPRFDVTAHLQSRNVLVVDLTWDAQNSTASEADYLGLVQLEIE